MRLGEDWTKLPRDLSFSCEVSRRLKANLWSIIWKKALPTPVDKVHILMVSPCFGHSILILHILESDISLCPASITTTAQSSA